MEQRMLGLIKKAQAGDEDAHREVAIYCFDRYSYRLNNLHSSDPAISMEDLRVTFFEGIWDGVMKADHRGNPLYHIGQRGMWRVKSEIRAIQQVMKKRSMALIGHENWEEGMWGDSTRPVIEPVDPAPDFREIVVSRVHADATVRILAHADLKPRTREAFDVILSGAAGDPEEPGFNRRLAGQLGVSPQRASQLVQDLRSELSR